MLIFGDAYALNPDAFFLISYLPTSRPRFCLSELYAAEHEASHLLSFDPFEHTGIITLQWEYVH
jgi:hypothetical protein